MGLTGVIPQSSQLPLPTHAGTWVRMANEKICTCMGGAQEMQFVDHVSLKVAAANSRRWVKQVIVWGKDFFLFSCFSRRQDDQSIFRKSNSQSFHRARIGRWEESIRSCRQEAPT